MSLSLEAIQHLEKSEVLSAVSTALNSAEKHEVIKTTTYILKVDSNAKPSD